ncbi:MAG: TonB-dependent receptor, partial [Bacteroidota bacterium]
FMTPSGVQLNDYVLEGTLSGPVPFANGVRYFLSARRDMDEGSIFGTRLFAPNDSANFNGAFPYWEIQGRPFWEYLPIDDPLVSQLGLDISGEFNRPLPNEIVPLNPREALNVLGKLSYRPFTGAKVEYSFLYDFSKFKPATFAYRFNPDGIGTRRERGYNHGLTWTQTLGDRAFYTFRGSYAQNRFRSFRFEDPTDPRYVKDLAGIGEGRVVGFPGSNFLFGGNEKGHIDEESRSVRLKLDYTQQIGATHEVKTGVELNLHSLDRENFVVLFDGNQFLEPTVPPLDSPSHDKYEDQRVTEVSAYLQDKLEFDDFIVNAGLRYEYFNPNGEYFPNLLDPFGERVEAEVKQLVLPRIGLSFPITETGIIHLSYGHFAQMPRLRNLYRNPEFEFPVGQSPLFGNTNMRPERTVQYEIGLQQQIGDLMAFDVTGYFKDIRDYLAQQTVRFSTIAGEDVYRIYLNRDYANVKGMTFALTRRRARGGLLSAGIDYTFQIAEGNNDDPNAFFFNFLSGRENEFELIPLDFDQQHVLSGTVTLSRPNNFGFSLIGQFATGYPYTPLLIDQKIDQLPNAGRKPTQTRLDAHLYKEVSVAGLRGRVFAKVFNVLDRLNERFVFDDTGRATYSLNGQRGIHAAWEPYYGLPGIQDLDTYNSRPNFFSTPREIQLGVSFGF